MKIRNGFVSNSSSSSFVLIGVATTEEDRDLIEEKRDADNWYPLPDGLDTINEENDYVGVKYRVEEYCTEEVVELTPELIQDVRAKLEKFLGRPVKHISLVAGMEAC